MAIVKAIDFGALVGGQLTALIEAEAQAAETSSEYIEKIGFTKNEKDGTLTPRMVVFLMKRRDTDGKIRIHRIRIPVLTLVPIPLLAISRATIDFDLQIEAMTEIKEKTEGNTRTNPNRSFGDFLKRKTKSKLMTRVARTSREQSTTRSDLKMSVIIEQSDLPIGISRLLEAAELSLDDDAGR